MRIVLRHPKRAKFAYEDTVLEIRMAIVPDGNRTCGLLLWNIALWDGRPPEGTFDSPAINRTADFPSGGSGR